MKEIEAGRGELRIPMQLAIDPSGSRPETRIHAHVFVFGAVFGAGRSGSWRTCPQYGGP